MIKAIVFDCFGVLAEDGWLPFKRKYIGNNKRLADDVADLGKQNEFGMVSLENYFTQVAKLISVDEKNLKAAVNRRVPNEDLFSFISSYLKPNYKIGLLSNANFNVIEKIFSEEQAKLFDASVLSYESKLIKPDPKIFELIAQRLNVQVSECLFIDDVDRYCLAAEEVGMKAIVYKNPEQAKTEIRLALEDYA